MVFHHLSFDTQTARLRFAGGVRTRPECGETAVFYFLLNSATETAIAVAYPSYRFRRIRMRAYIFVPLIYGYPKL